MRLSRAEVEGGPNDLRLGETHPPASPPAPQTAGRCLLPKKHFTTFTDRDALRLSKHKRSQANVEKVVRLSRAVVEGGPNDLRLGETHPPCLSPHRKPQVDALFHDVLPPRRSSSQQTQTLPGKCRESRETFAGGGRGRSERSASRRDASTLSLPAPQTAGRCLLPKGISRRSLAATPSIATSSHAPHLT